MDATASHALFWGLGFPECSAEGAGGTCAFFLVLTGQLGAHTAQHGRYSRVAAVHIRMAAAQQQGRKLESAPGGCSEVCGGPLHP